MKTENKKVFNTTNGLRLIIKYRKSAVIFEIDKADDWQERFVFNFTDNDFRDLLYYLEAIANKAWNNINPREADSLASDYDEYYDKKFDSNGCLRIKENTLIIERPSLESNKLYQFNKRKIESFIYDFRGYIK